MSDVITFYESAKIILQKFNADKRVYKSPDEEKNAILKLAAKFIVNDIHGMYQDPNLYFKLDDVDAETQLSLVPESLQLFVSGLKKRTKACPLLLLDRV